MRACVVCDNGIVCWCVDCVYVSAFCVCANTYRNRAEHHSTSNGRYGKHSEERNDHRSKPHKKHAIVESGTREKHWLAKSAIIEAH